MHLYDCRLDTFIPLATSGQIADILRARFVDRLEENPSESERNSWRNSLGAFADTIDGVGMDDAWIILEYQLPLSSARLDSMIVGTDQAARKRAVVIEFKQWDRCDVSRVPDAIRIMGTELLHPCAQARGYRQYLEDAHSAFSDGGTYLSSCAYLHNVRSIRGSNFFDERYAELLQDTPAFCVDNVDDLAPFVGEQTRFGASADEVESILSGSYRPSKKLLDHVVQAIDGYEPWTLLDEQQVVLNAIMAEIEEARAEGGKRVIIVTGGPGTGKSVIAVQVVGAAARKGYGVVHATGSKAFTTNMRGIVGRSEMFRYFNSFTKARADSIELMVCDEAHRLRESSGTRFRPRGDRPQVGEIVDAARVSVFLLDQNQSVRKNEVGSVRLIEEYAVSEGIPLSMYDLRTQFRCAGSDSYIRWVDHLFGFARNRSLAWKAQDDYEVRTFDQVQDLEYALISKVGEGCSARLVAGFCWPWSDPYPNGSLHPDVVVGGWRRPWNRKPRDMWRNRGNAEPPDRHPYKIWATQPEGFDQVGCIYSAQGFEFDYVGVIWAPDLGWDPVSGGWIAHLAENEDVAFKRGLVSDPELAVQKLCQIYRVLSTRGMKGTYFYFLDDATRQHFERVAGGL